MNLTFSILLVAAVMIAVEAARPGRSWPRVAGWWGRAALLNGLQAGVAYCSAFLWDRWMAEHRPWTADALGPVAGPIAGYLTITFIYYWWHRWRHTVPFLWRWFHQVHHSPQRIEIITSFYKHPVEIVVNGILSSAIVYFVVGLDPAGASIAVLLTGLAELFYHWNVSTPRWLGFLVQRPESHCIHHQEGVHSFNYADLPLWDMLFGTFRNPVRFAARCGFGPQGELRLGTMLRGVDLSRVADRSRGLDLSRGEAGGAS
jgi:sterol desaturase/sphingolipid hydroxylase (fatty acid hydroxylase superfamily)